ncbi:unnamed protein product [Polarella glacialis]|uniref:Uncharacterized protein n=1 Tax=Polarella glacialis TaxID=89957 RepID=A0A813IR81_POLGL|nr:unnamed protein product [Polarella glacialis]
MNRVVVVVAVVLVYRDPRIAFKHMVDFSPPILQITIDSTVGSTNISLLSVFSLLFVACFIVVFVVDTDCQKRNLIGTDRTVSSKGTWSSSHILRRGILFAFVVLFVVVADSLPNSTAT